ncbi:MAG: hypothetical protein IJ705_01780 [Oscillospiraceae bacterium]|nr:hypothetical protein [Oscillospiraceae bacterium]
MLVCAPPDAEGAAEAAERSGYAWYAPDFIVQADSIPDILEETEGDVALLLDCAAASGAAEALADYLAERHYDVGRPREIDTIRRPTT